MATIRRRTGALGDSWQVQVRLAGEAARTKSFHSREEATTWGREQEAAAASHRRHQGAVSVEVALRQQLDAALVLLDAERAARRRRTVRPIFAAELAASCYPRRAAARN